GIVNWVVPRAALAEETAKLARKLADGPTVALGLAKRLIRSSLDHSWDEHSHREAESFAAAAATQDHLEGVSAFVEKRQPVFSGRELPHWSLPIDARADGRRGRNSRRRASARKPL